MKTGTMVLRKLLYQTEQLDSTLVVPVRSYHSTIRNYQQLSFNLHVYAFQCADEMSSI